MGLLDSLLGKAQYTPARVPVDGAVGRWTASRMSGGLAAAGGEIVLTPEHLVFTPWDMTKTREFLVKLLSKAGVPHVGDVDKLLTATKLLEPVAIPLTQIATVQPMGRASLLKPPWARITFVDNQAFDDWLGKLRAQQSATAGG